MVGEDLYRVYRTQNGYLATQKLVDGRLTYIKGGVAVVAEHGRRATHTEVGALGQKFGNCLVCGRPLSDDGDNRSMRVGYGPKCASKMGWPWG